MEEGIEGNKKESLEGESGTALQAAVDTLPSTEFVKVEKNLASLGFFTPSSKRLRNATEKSFTITTIADGQRLELKGTIIPSAKYGLPITADQDKWIALCKILTDIIRKEGRVTNPVSFTSAEILRLLHTHRHSGKNYREIEEWLDVLFSTTIFSEGVVYLAEEKRRVKDRFRVFERAVSFGKELPGGQRADKNYVWFSDWQLQNINANHLLPIDLEAYRELKNHIAKALVPLLQVWLYATRDHGVFEKRYSELCEILNIRQYQYLSLILQTLGPSLDELKQFGYIADWRIERTKDDESYKVIFQHGEKFHSDRRAQLSRKQKANNTGELKGRDHPVGPPQSNNRVVDQPIRLRESTPASLPVFDPNLVAEFTRRGIAEHKAQELLANIKPGQDVVAQLEYLEREVERAQTTRWPIKHPDRFIASLIEKNSPIPDGFETSAKRKAREEREQKERVARAAKEAEQQLQWEYDDYCERQVDTYIEANQATFEAIKNAKWEEDRQKYSFTTESMARIAARFEIRKQLTLPTFEEFLDHKRQGTDFSLKPVGGSPSPDPISEPPAAAEPTPAVNPEPAPLASAGTPPPEELGDQATETPSMAAENPAMASREPAVIPATPEPMIVELVSEPPQQ